MLAILEPHSDLLRSIIPLLYMALVTGMVARSTYLITYRSFHNLVPTLPPRYLAVITAAAWILYSASTMMLMAHGTWSLGAVIFLACCAATFWTDGCFYLIHRIWSLGGAVFLVLLAALGQGLVTLPQAGAGIAYGYGLLWLLARWFKHARGIDGLGQGDAEFMCLIGAGLGLAGTWLTLLVASLTGIVCHTATYILTRRYPQHIPFGMYLALAGSLVMAFQLTNIFDHGVAC